MHQIDAGEYKIVIDGVEFDIPEEEDLIASFEKEAAELEVTVDYYGGVPLTYKKIDDPIFRLLSAKHQVENVMKLLEDNPYEKYMYMHLNTVYYELERQISLHR